MPKKKVPVKLPKVSASFSAVSASVSTEVPQSSVSSRNPFDADISELLASKDDWSVQEPSEIIQEAKKSVQARKPWRSEEATKVKRDLEDAVEGCHIILPDNRVVAVESQLSRRLVDELLGNVPREMKKVLTSQEEEVDFKLPSKPRRRQAPDEVYLGDESKKSPQKKMRNPWYLPPKVWYSGQMGKDPNEDLGLGFPYDTFLGESRPARPLEEEPAVMEKDISVFLETAKKHFQASGHRLPHFLQVAMGQGHGGHS
mmetsp:Transcript_30599/g.49205  ORF Transcript_30599/g.49205 Transcript_30599/m.49205 type:complete len:257 (+) Transcript_30599:48-818(+)